MVHRKLCGFIAAALLSFLSAYPVTSAAALAGTFTVSPTSGNAPLSATLSWSVTGSTAATTCVSTGSWTGSKATSGSLGVTNLLSSAAYTLTCTTPAKPAVPSTPWTATLSWQPPTQNTDGTNLTNLAGFRVLYGSSATALNQTIDVPGAGHSTYAVDISVTGTTFFAVKAYTCNNPPGCSEQSESSNSNVVSKAGTVTAGVPGVPADVWTRTVSVAVTPQPEAPILSVAANAPAYKLNIGNADKVSMIQVGKTKARTSCDPVTAVLAANTQYNLVKRQNVVALSGSSIPTNVMQTFARCSKVG